MVYDDKFLCKKKNSSEKTDFLAGHRGISEISETGISQFQSIKWKIKLEMKNRWGPSENG